MADESALTRFSAIGQADVMETGLTDLDTLVQFHPGELVFITGGTGVGKSSLALQFARNLAKRQRKTMFFSFESSVAQIHHRLLSAESSIPLAQIQAGYIKDEQLDDLKRAGDVLGQATLAIQDELHESLDAIKGIVAEHNERHPDAPLQAVIIDALSYFSRDGNADANTRLILDLKKFARHDRMLIVTTCHAYLEGASDAQLPPPSQYINLGSWDGALQHSDSVLYLHALADPGQYEHFYRSEISITVVKSRNGPPGSIRACFARDVLAIRSQDTDRQ